MSDLRDLYQEMILDHGKNPRNRRAVQDSNCAAEGYNPLCGDRLVLKLRLAGDVIEDAGFSGQGCAISTAAASTMTELIKGMDRRQAEELFKQFHTMLTDSEGHTPAGLPPKLAVFAGVAEFPMRVKCATLAWHTLHAALHGHDVASTE